MCYLAYDYLKGHYSYNSQTQTKRSKNNSCCNNDNYSFFHQRYYEPIIHSLTLNVTCLVIVSFDNIIFGGLSLFTAEMTFGAVVEYCTLSRFLIIFDMI